MQPYGSEELCGFKWDAVRLLATLGSLKPFKVRVFADNNNGIIVNLIFI